MQAQQIITEEVIKKTEFFFRVPIDNQEMLPTLLPLIAGGVIMELYFGKHKQESLGWNTSVGNAAIWMTTGLTILISETGLSQPELRATYALIALGGVVAFMDFFHIWSASVAFIISSSAMVYTLAYALVVVIKSSMAVNQTTIKAAALFFLLVNVGFKIIQSFETDTDSNLNI